ncbi:hypothetical protein [Actinomyces ruminis]|uniref:Serine/threonine protein phosphatase n=1 Tax=Actinomyces ruminis TaxID=1937003 RepID=A0ABX4MGQ3_9ACTO|nr:hypothetical protein [Actinomyces ruminis]PHP53304.1 serine/threonine protein phosphatase [Actinomyces ruminis]
MSPEHPHTRPGVSPDVFDHRRRENLELDETEAILDEIGLRLLAQDWLLAQDADIDDGTIWVPARISEIHRDHVVVTRVADELSGHVAKATTWAGTVELELPTARLRPAR